MSGRVIAAVSASAVAAFGVGYALAAGGDQPTDAATPPKPLEAPAASISVPPADPSEPLPRMIRPPRATPEQSPPSSSTAVPQQPPVQPPPSGNGGIIEG